MNELFIGYGQIDPSAKPNSAPTAPDKQRWANIDDLKLDDIEVKNVATCEHNQAILNGSQEHLPDNPEAYRWGLWSATFSDESGIFENPPTLDISFAANQKAPGLSLIFYPHSDDYANSVRITWYNSTNAVIKTGTYAVTSNREDITESVTNFRRITVEFLSTNIRHRYIKLAGINYGTGRTFFDDEIHFVNILEEVDPTSNRVSVNTAGFRIKTKSPEFSLVSGITGDNMLIENQIFTIKRNDQDFGTFFLQFPWKDVYGNGLVFDFQTIDPIGVMDKYQFWGGIYNNVLIEAIISELFTICFPTEIIKYQIDPYFSGRRVSGLIPICTCREALQLICFSIGAVADDSRRDYVWIYPPDTEVAHIISEYRMTRNSSTISPTDYCSGVDVIAHEYVPSSEIVEAHNGILEAGQREIRFNEPLYNITVSGATILSQSANHVLVSVPQQQNVTVKGYQYIINQTVFSAGGEVSAGEVESVVIYDNCTLAHPSYAQSIADSTYKYLRQRAQIETDVRLEDLETGYMAQVPTYGNPINGTIEQLDIQLRGGKARMKVVGDVDTASI